VEVSDPLFVSSFVRSLLEFLLDIFTVILSIYSYLLVHYMSLLFGSWLVFISEMSTLSDGSWAELSMSMECWIFEYLVEVDGWTDCAITDF